MGSFGSEIQMNTLVSIIITTYNRTQWLDQAIQSAINQTYQPTELIIIDDGSYNQDARAIADRYSQVRYFYQKNNGLGSARNFGIASCKGDWIQFLDDDDWLELESIEKKVKCRIENPRVSVVYSDLFMFEEDHGIVCKYYDGFPRPLPAGDIYSTMARRNFIPIHAMLMEKKALVKVKGFPTRCGAEDWECLVKISEFSQFVFVDKPLGYYRLHQGNMTYKSDQQITGETLTQKYVISSQAFQQITADSRKKIIAGYSWQQWRDGDPLFARQLLAIAGGIEGNQTLFFILKILMLFGRPLSRFIHNTFIRIRFFIRPYPISYRLFMNRRFKQISIKE